MKPTRTSGSKAMAQTVVLMFFVTMRSFKRIRQVVMGDIPRTHTHTHTHTQTQKHTPKVKSKVSRCEEISTLNVNIDAICEKKI